MDFINAVGMLKDGQAVKVPSFAGGYVKRDDVPKTLNDAWDRKYRLTFVTRANGTTTSASYAFVVEETGGNRTVTGPSTPLSLDPQLLESILFDSAWDIKSSHEYESARTDPDRIW